MKTAAKNRDPGENQDFSSCSAWILPCRCRKTTLLQQNPNFLDSERGYFEAFKTIIATKSELLAWVVVT